MDTEVVQQPTGPSLPPSPSRKKFLIHWAAVRSLLLESSPYSDPGSHPPWPQQPPKPVLSLPSPGLQGRLSHTPLGLELPQLGAEPTSITVSPRQGGDPALYSSLCAMNVLWELGDMLDRYPCALFLSRCSHRNLPSVCRALGRAPPAALPLPVDAKDPQELEEMRPGGTWRPRPASGSGRPDGEGGARLGFPGD